MLPERKTVLITGAASGIGRATVERFAADPNYDPIIAVDQDPMVDLPRVIPKQVKLGLDGSVERILQEAFDSSGRLDVLVNGAGMMIQGDPMIMLGRNKMRQQECKEMNDVNISATLRSIVTGSRLMREQGGIIITITSAKHFYPDIYHLSYLRKKATLSRVIKGLRKSCLREGVSLVDVQPGNTRTNIDRGHWVSGNNKDEIEAVSSVNLWWRKHFGNDPRNVANVIYEIAEGKRKGSPVYIGLDTQIGHLLYLTTYPTVLLRSDMLFFYGSTIFYKTLTMLHMIRKRLAEKPQEHPSTPYDRSGL